MLSADFYIVHGFPGTAYDSSAHKNILEVIFSKAPERGNLFHRRTVSVVVFVQAKLSMNEAREVSRIFPTKCVDIVALNTGFGDVRFKLHPIPGARSAEVVWEEKAVMWLVEHDQHVCL